MAPQPIITRPGLFTFVSPHSRRFREIVIVASVFILLIIWIDYSYNYAERNSNHIPLTKSRRNQIHENGAPQTRDNSFNNGKDHRKDKDLPNLEPRRQGLTNLLVDPDSDIAEDDDGKDEKNELVAKKIVANSNIEENKLHSKACVCPALKPDKVKLTGVVDEETSDGNLQFKPYDIKMICENYSADRSNDRIFPNQSLIKENRIVIHKVSIFCLIIPNSQDDFDLFVKPTWVKKCKNYFAEQRKEILGLSQEMKYLEKLNKKNPEWVIVSNCQNFLVMENIQFFLQKFSPSQRLVFQVTDSVFILSNAAMRKAVNNFNSPNCGKANTLFKCLNGSMKIYSLKDSMYEPISIAMRREKSIQSDRRPLLIQNTPPHQMHTIEFMIYNMHLKEIYQSGKMHTLEFINSTEDKGETEQINIKSDSVVRPDTEDIKNQIPTTLSPIQKLKRDGNIRRIEKDKGEIQEVNIKNGGVIRSDIQDKNSLSPGYQSKRDGDADIPRTEKDIGKGKVNIKPSSDVHSDTDDNKYKTPTTLPPVEQFKQDTGANIRNTEEGKEEAHLNIKPGSDVRPDTDDNEVQTSTLHSPAQQSRGDTNANIRKTNEGKEEAHVNIKPGNDVRPDTDDNEVQNYTLHSPAQQSKGDTGANIRKTEEGKEEHINIKPGSEIRPDTDDKEVQTSNLHLPAQQSKGDTDVNIRKTDEGKEEAHVNIKRGSDVRPDTDDNEVQNSTLHSPAQQSKEDTGANIRKTEEGKEEAHINIKSGSDIRPDTDDNEVQTSNLHLPAQQSKGDTDANIRKTDEGKEEARENSKPGSDVRPPDTDDDDEDQTSTSISRIQQSRRGTDADIHRTHNQNQTHVGRRENNVPALVLQKAQGTIKAIKGIESDNIVKPLSEKESGEKFKELIEENVSKSIKMVPNGN